MDDALTEKARTMALQGAAILEKCREVGNWPATLRGVDFAREEQTPLALIAPSSQLAEGLEILGITYQVAHNTLLIRRGDIPPEIANDAWRTIAAQHELEGART